MPVTHASQIETSVSRLPQSAYGTPRASGDEYWRVVNESPTVASKSLNFEDDAGYENGSDLAVETWATTADTGIETNPRFNFRDIGLHLHRALGGYSVSGPDGGLYTHVFTPQSMNTSRQLPASTFLKKYGGLRLEMLPDMVSSAFSISGGKMGRIATSHTFVGSGNYSKNPASYVSAAMASNLEYAHGGQATVRMSQSGVGTRQVETATAVGTASSTTNLNVIITASGLTGSPLTIPVAVATGDTAAVWAAKVRTALRANTVVRSMFEVTGSSTAIVLTKWLKEANDGTLNIEIAPLSSGVTAAPTSTNTTAGVVGVSQNYSCLLESWGLQLNNPTADDGYRQCSPYIIAGDPNSGVIRSEYLVGARDYTFNFSARDDGTDKTEDWMRAGTYLDLDIPIVGIEANDFSLRIQHTRARIIQANPITNAGGDFIGVDGVAKLHASATGDGSIPLTATLVNNIPSYVS
jgi:hypothetical protein